MVLGISPGTRTTGIAVLINGTPTHWQLLSFSESWTDTKKQKILTTIRYWVRKHRIQQVAIKIPDNLPISRAYIELVGALNVLCEQHRIVPTYYTLTELKEGYFPDKVVSKPTLIHYLLKQHPDLHTHRRNTRKKGYDKIYEAVGVARLTHLYSHLPD